MPRIVPLSKEVHAGKQWIRDAGHAWASSDSVVPLGAQEMPRATLIYPLALLGVEDNYVPVAVVGLGRNKNLFVAPDGRWIGGYMPMIYQAHPFVLANEEHGQPIVCVNHDSELLSEEKGEALSNPEGRVIACA